MYRFDGSTVLVIKTDLTYTVTLQTFCTLLSGNRRDAAVSQPLLRQPPAEAERVAWVEIGVASRPASVRSMALQPRRLLARAAAARGEAARNYLLGSAPSGPPSPSVALHVKEPSLFEILHSDFRESNNLFELEREIFSNTKQL